MKNIIRIEKRKKFTVISRGLLEDNRLKWATRGILGYLLSKPDNWILQIADLRNNGDLGKDALYARIREAIQFGYISRTYQRDEKGRVLKVEYVVREDPVYPYPEKPEMANPDLDKPDTDNTDNNKETSVSNTEKITTTAEASPSKNMSTLIFPEFDTAEELSLCKATVENLDDEYQQPILDELAARMTCTKLDKLDNPIGYLKGWLIKRLHEGDMPCTSRGAQLAANRDDPEFRLKQFKKENRHKMIEITSDINHLNQLIEFQRKQGTDPVELLQQREKKQANLNEFKSCMRVK